jgi:hypothetical protein
LLKGACPNIGNKHIASNARLHLAARVELPATPELPTRKRIAGIERGKTVTLDVNNTLRYGGGQND